jgi:hypothetical protein
LTARPPWSCLQQMRHVTATDRRRVSHAKVHEERGEGMLDGKWGAFTRARLKMCSSELMSVAKQHEWCMRCCEYPGKFAEMRRPRQVHPRDICADITSCSVFVSSARHSLTGSHRHDDASGYVPKACAAAAKCAAHIGPGQTASHSTAAECCARRPLTAGRSMRRTRTNARLRQFESGNAHLRREP